MIFGGMAFDVPDPGAPGLSTAEFLKEIEAGIAEPHRDRTNHPFVHAVLEGKATPRQIGGWLLQFRLWADPLNKNIGILYANVPDSDLRAALLENLLEEEKGMTSGLEGHVALINASLEELGFSKKDRETALMLPESWAFYHWVDSVMKTRPFFEGMLVLAMSEKINPIVFSRLAQGLRKHYKISERALQAFDVHAGEVEEEHAKLGAIVLDRYVTTRYWQEQVKFLIFHNAEVYYRFFNVWTAY